MELDDLLAYARDKYQITEEYRWAEWPNYSVLTHPETEKDIALCMREWDEETGEFIERLDLKCGQSCLDQFQAPYLTRPFQMKNSRWIGIIFDSTTEESLVAALFDLAVILGKAGGYTVVLDHNRMHSGEAYRDTALPFSKSTYRPEKADIPEKILKMRRINALHGDSYTVLKDTFYKQAVFMADYEEEEDIPFVGTPPSRLFPTYSNFSNSQLRAYFSWRTKVRKGIYEPIPADAVFIYSFELANGIGAKDVEDRMRKLSELRDHFEHAGDSAVSYNEDVRERINTMIPNIGILLGVSPEVICRYADPQYMVRDRMLEILEQPRNFSDEEVVRALMYFTSARLQNSTVLQKEPERGTHLFAESWRIGNEMTFTYRSKYSKNGTRNLFHLCFGEQSSYAWHPMINTLFHDRYPSDETEYVLNSVHSFHYRSGYWTQTAYFKQGYSAERFDGFLHKADGMFRKYLRTGRSLKDKISENWALPPIEAAIEQDRRALREARRNSVSIDLSGLEQIRQDADRTKDSLLTEADAMMQDSVETLPAEVSSDTYEEGKTACGLDPLYSEILRKLLAGEDIKAMIKDHHLLPAIIADTINEAFYDEIGDTVLICEDDVLSIMEDYREDVERMIGGIH